MLAKTVIKIGAFAKWRKATISFVISMCMSVRLSASNIWTDGHEICYITIFGNPWEKNIIIIKI
jgi:hypothetical protein